MHEWAVSRQARDWIFAGAYGLADRARGIANTLDTRFRNGSLTKMFTGVAMGQLIQSGAVEPAAPLAATEHRLLDERHTTLVTTGRGTFGWDARRVCYGFFEEAMGGIRTFSHIGGAPGMSADFVVWPDTGLFITVLANVDPPVAPEVSRFVLSLLPLPA